MTNYSDSGNILKVVLSVVMRGLAIIMKKLLCLLLIVLFLFSACSSDSALNIYKDAILNADSKMDEIFSSNDIKNTIISTTPEGLSVYKYAGSNTRFNDICSQMNELCTPDVVETIMAQRGFVSVNGDIGVVSSTNTFFYSVTNDSKLKKEDSADENIAIILITKFAQDRTSSQTWKYVFETTNDQLKIVDLEIN